MRLAFGILVLGFLGLLIIGAAGETHSTYNGTYCKGGYVFLDVDTWHGNNDPQLINENGGGVKCQ